jgi:hypothetical protein
VLCEETQVFVPYPDLCPYAIGQHCSNPDMATILH